MAQILIIDDDKMIGRMLQQSAARLGYDAMCARTLKEGTREVMSHAYDLVFLDVGLPDGNGLNALPLFRKSPGKPEVIMITGVGDPDGAELAIKNDAWDYLQKPFSLKDLNQRITRLIQYRREKARTRIPMVLNREGIVGSSPQLRACLEELARMAPSDANLLINGETGTGKELFARAIHRNSPRRSKNFVVVDCAALPETLVESMLFGHDKGAFTGADKSRQGLIKEADGGTLFLDEIGELSLGLQKTFLRLLQERRFRPIGADRELSSDFRLVAATNRNLEEMVKRGQFRRDLYFRLNSLGIQLPPLRERQQDIKDLTMHYLVKLCERYGLEIKDVSPEFIEMLTHYHWPGNARELVHTMECAITLAQLEPTLCRCHLPTQIRIHSARASVQNRADAAALPPISDPARPAALPSLKQYRTDLIAEGERVYLECLMSRCRGDIKQACALSGLGRARLYGLLKKYEISRFDEGNLSKKTACR